MPLCHVQSGRLRRGFTLVELIVALAITGIVLSAVSSLIGLTAKVMPTRDDVNTTIVHDRVALDAMVADIDAATSVLSLTPTSIRLQMQDMDGDGNPETITYSWSGTPGNGLMRTYNTGTPVAIITNVQSLAFTGSTRTHARSTTSAAAWDTTHLLFWCDANSTSLDSFDIQALTRAASVFTPDLPSDATQFTIDSVKVMLAGKSPYSGSLAVSITAVGLTGTPNTLLTYGSATVSEPNTSTPALVPVSLAAGPFAPGTSLALVVGPGVTLDSTPGVVSMVTDQVADANGWSLTSNSSGTLWSTNADGSIVFEVYGRVARPVVTSTTATRNTAVRVSLTKSDGTVHAAVGSIMAQPE